VAGEQQHVPGQPLSRRWFEPIQGTLEGGDAGSYAVGPKAQVIQQAQLR